LWEQSEEIGPLAVLETLYRTTKSCRYPFKGHYPNRIDEFQAVETYGLNWLVDMTFSAKENELCLPEECAEEVRSPIVTSHVIHSLLIMTCNIIDCVKLS